MSFFAGAKDTTVTGGCYTAIQGDNYVVHGNLAVNESEAGISALKAASALGATHDSFERHPLLKCYPGTRKTALHLIDSWMNDMESKRDHLIYEPHDAPSSGTPGPTNKPLIPGRILWLHAPAGAGKSAVAQTIAQTYAECRRLLGSFFFSRGTPGRDTAHRLFPTLTYQIAIAIPTMRAWIESTVKSDPSIFDKSLDTQVQRLIVLPYQQFLSSAVAQVNQAPFLLVLDGLDECGEQEDQCVILRLVADLLYKFNLPLCVLIVSRPEPHIKGVLRSDAFRSYGIIENVSLYADKNYWEMTSDIRAFLLAEFNRIHHSERHQEFMKYVSPPWPAENIIDNLVWRSGGYFIYIATVIRFVDQEFFHPADRLKLVLDAASPDGFPFERLDSLYRQILSTNPNTDLLLKILGSLLISQASSIIVHDVKRCTPELMERILVLQQGTVRSMLRGMHSLLRMDDEVVTPFHASFPDFLFDRRRAGVFFIDPGIYHGYMAVNLLKIVDRWELDSTSQNERKLFASWPFHARKSSDPSSVFDKIRVTEFTLVIRSWASENLTVTMFYHAIEWLRNQRHQYAWVLVNEMKYLLDCAFIKAITELGLDVVIIQGLFSLLETFTEELPEPFVRFIHDVEQSAQCSHFRGFMNDAKRSNGIFASRAVCHTRLALSCMYLLAYPTVVQLPDGVRSDYSHSYPSRPPTFGSDAYHWYKFFTQHERASTKKISGLYDNPGRGWSRISYSRQNWAAHLSLSPPGNNLVLHCLRDVGKHLVNWSPSCLTSSTMHHDGHPVCDVADEHEDHVDWVFARAATKTTHEADLSNARAVIKWLKKMRMPPRDLLQEWTPCLRCGLFHSAGMRDNYNEDQKDKNALGWTGKLLRKSSSFVEGFRGNHEDA